MTLISEIIEKEVFSLLEAYVEPYCYQDLSFKTNSCQCADDVYQVEVRGYYKNIYKPEEQTSCILLRVFVYHEFEQVHITNIFLPDFMRHNGIGKKIIYKIFLITKNEKYSLWLVDMVESFYRKMIQRGAIPCRDSGDAVQIVNGTKLD